MTIAIRKGEPGEYTDAAVVATSMSVGRGVPVVVDTSMLATPATEGTALATHVAYSTEDGTWPATAGDRIGVVKIGAPCTIPVLVGTGGATKGKYGVAYTDGVIDKTTGGGTTLCVPICEFEETGTVGSFVGGWLAVSRTVSA